MPHVDRNASQTGATQKARKAAFCVIVLTATALCSQSSIGQVFLATPAPAQQSDETTSSGFDLGVDESLQAVVEDFQRFSRRGLWEKAIESLEKVDQEKLKTGLLASEDGTVLPAGEQLWRLQAGLSGEFREAFQVFLNAKARKVFDSALATGVKPKDRDARLDEIFRTYFVSSVGDDASNLLGDRSFRSGKFNEAVRYWQSVLDYHPDSEISEARLVFKIGVAAAMMSDRDLFDDSLRTLTERFPSETTTFAGNEVVAAEALAKLASRLEDDTNAANAGSADEPASGDLSMPESLEVAWRHVLADDKQIASLNQNQNSYYRYKGIEYWVAPTSVADGKLAYNYFGSIGCVDLETGKLLWRQNDIDDAVEKLAGNIYQFSVDMYGIGAGAQSVVCRYVPPDEMNYYRAGADLVAYSTEDGKKQWDVDLEKRGQSDWFHVGNPMVETINSGDETIVKSYVLAVKQSGSDPYLRIHEGRSKPSVEIRLGRYRNINMTDYNDKLIPNPVILGWSDDRHLLVAMDEGALIAVDTEAKKIAWGYRYEAPTIQSGRQSADVMRGILHPRASAIRTGGTVFLKDARRSTLVSFDLRKRRATWTRKINPVSEVVAHDPDRVFVLGEELLALDRETGTLKWAAQLPMANGGLSAEVIGESIVVFTSRGLYELNRQDGSLIRIHRDADAESNGGRVLRVHDKLVTVSERAITAWNLSLNNTTPAAHGGSSEGPE